MTATIQIVLFLLAVLVLVAVVAQRLKTAPPILLVGGTNDPATPYAWAQSVNRQINGSVLLTRQGNGHTSFGSSSCARAAEEAYLINLTLPLTGTVCSS